jgi:N-acetyl-anhydromuramoyl-L-alanine amidase
MATLSHMLKHGRPRRMTVLLKKPQRRARLRVQAANGRLAGAVQVPSPNCDARPTKTNIDLIVVHGISLPPGRFGGPWIDRLFTNTLPADRHAFFASVATARVSAHLLIRRGGAIRQYVSFNQRAWHAGQSVYRGREACNDFSIGIELEGTDDRPYTAQQYKTLVACVNALCRAYSSLSLDNIVGHSDIAPGRKTDPGPSFDWPKFRSMLAARNVTQITLAPLAHSGGVRKHQK